MPYSPTVDLGRYSNYSANVKDWGALGDGVSDDTNAIANAIIFVSSSGGGDVFFPAGTYITRTQILYSKVHLRGAGIEASILKLKDGTNADLLQGAANGYSGAMVDIAATNATGSVNGIYNWSVQNMTLDGNRSNQTSGSSYCLCQYGFGFIIANVRMRNGRSGGLLSDWNGGVSAGIDSMEAQISNVKIHDCGGIGFEFGGPHDSQISQLLVFNSGATNIHIGPNATAILMTNCHAFSPGLGTAACSFLIEGGYGQYSNCVSEGSDTCNTAILAGDIEWFGHTFGIVGNPTLQAQIGVQLGQVAGQLSFAGSVHQADGLTTAWVASGCLVVANFNLNNGGAINFANETNNYVQVISYNTSGSCMIGMPNAQTHFEVLQNGLTPDGSFAKSGGICKALKSNQAWRLTDRVQDIINMNTNSKKLELINSTVLVTYTDNYGTHSFETLGDVYGTVRFANDMAATIARRAAGVLAFGGTIALAQSGSAQSLVTGSTITIANLGVVRLSMTSDVTDIKVSSGTYAGQFCLLINESAYTVTFDIPANSFIAAGTSDILPANAARLLVWNSGLNLWYRAA
jgi:hypothetical protein